MNCFPLKEHHIVRPLARLRDERRKPISVDSDCLAAHAQYVIVYLSDFSWSSALCNHHLQTNPKLVNDQSFSIIILGQLVPFLVM